MINSPSFLYLLNSYQIGHVKGQFMIPKDS